MLAMQVSLNSTCEKPRKPRLKNAENKILVFMALINKIFNNDVKKLSRKLMIEITICYTKLKIKDFQFGLKSFDTGV